MEPSAREVFTTQFREDFVPEFEFRKSLLRRTCTTEWVASGRDARFLISGGKGIETVTRGPNGRIPGRPPNNRTETVTLSEEHDVAEETGFDIFVAQGRQVEIMQYSTIGVMNRRYDTQIIEALSKATRGTGAPQIGGLDLALHAKAALGASEVDHDGMLTAVISPAFEANLMKEDSFSSADFVTFAPLDGSDPKDSGYGYYRWLGVNWIVHPRLPGAGTNDERCFMYHKYAIGHACDSENMRMAMDYNSRHDYSWCRVSAFCGAELLQDDGVIVMPHDGSTFATTPV